MTPLRTTTVLIISMMLQAAQSFADNPEIHTIIKDGWCEDNNILECMNDKYSDTTAFDAKRGYSFPTNGGIYGVISRHYRFKPDDERAWWFLPTRKMLTDHDDILIPYTATRGKPTSEQILTSLTMLSEEVLENVPSDNPASYLFMQKIIESALYISALEDNRGIYSRVERFRNCVQITIMKGDIEMLHKDCRAELLN